MKLLHVIMKTIYAEEREKLFDEVEQEWKKRESKALERQETLSTDNDDDEEDDSSDEIEECIVKVRLQMFILTLPFTIYDIDVKKYSVKKLNIKK